MKHPVIASCAALVALAAALSARGPMAAPAAAATPPPTPPPINAPASSAPQTPSQSAATPAPLPSGFAMPGAYASPGASPGGSPPPPPSDARKGLEGVWEVQIQRNDRTDYTHFKLAQTGTALTGTYLDKAGKRFPLAGSVDGQQIRLIVSLPDGTTILLEGRLDGTTDMLGMLTTSKEQIPFTASYRPKEKWIENVNPAPGGMGGMGQPGGGAPGGGGGGGYTPPR